MSVRKIMQPVVAFVRPDDTVRRAAQVMAEHCHQPVPVIDDDERVVGFISECDLFKLILPEYARNMDELGFVPDNLPLGTCSFTDTADLPVAQAMTTDSIHTVTEDEPVAEVIRTMLKYGVGQVPVVRDGRIVGMVSHGDLTNELIHPCLENSDSQ